jgi:RNA polymerase II subunit A-like phosphatase
VGELMRIGVRIKNLKRLFPTDQSMVVVIDDRGDVWGEIPNLVKVIPCEWVSVQL